MHLEIQIDFTWCEILLWFVLSIEPEECSIKSSFTYMNLYSSLKLHHHQLHLRLWGQLNNLYHMTSYGVPDFDSLIDCKCVCYTSHDLSTLYQD